MTSYQRHGCTASSPLIGALPSVLCKSPRCMDLSPSLLFWQKPHRQGGASSARRAGCIELYGFQHPVEGAKTAQAPRHWVHREYLGTGFCGGCAGMTGCSFSSLRLLDDLLLSAPRLDDHCPLFPPKARGNVSCSRSLISALKVS